MKCAESKASSSLTSALEGREAGELQESSERGLVTAYTTVEMSLPVYKPGLMR